MHIQLELILMIDRKFGRKIVKPMQWNVKITSLGEFFFFLEKSSNLVFIIQSYKILLEKIIVKFLFNIAWWTPTIHSNKNIKNNTFILNYHIKFKLSYRKIKPTYYSKSPKCLSSMSLSFSVDHIFFPKTLSLVQTCHQYFHQ